MFSMLWTCLLYTSHFHTFEMDGFTVRIENSLLAEALENLDGKKRDVILRYYFLGFDDTEISKILEVNRSTIQRRIPVSYTHLDVYKRQGKQSVGNIPAEEPQ